MEFRKFGNTDLLVTPISYGAWEIGGAPFFKNVSESDAIATIRAAYEMGINLFDTAPVYGFGRSETIMGKAVKGFRDRIVISTKCGLRWKNESFDSVYKNASGASILEEVDMSLRRLDTDFIDLYLIHWPDVDTKTPIEESIDALQSIKEAGKIRYYGVSNFSTAQMKEANAYGTISVLQSQYNMLNTVLENSELPYCHEAGIGFQAYSPLLRGVLTDATIDSLKLSGQLATNWALNSLTPSRTEALKRIKEISAKYGVPLSTFATGWTISQPNISTAIVGTTRIEHLKTATAGTGLHVSDEDQQAIHEIILGTISQKT
ncbi:MAG: aldo/keto reductase [Nitrospirae bacterium]|nr:aldo/keto reductase [Nitrospirota bacterium]